MKTTNKFLALALMAVAMVLASCSSDDDLAVPSQQVIESSIIGKWKIVEREGKPVPTDLCVVTTFAKDGHSKHSFYYYDEANKHGAMVANSSFEYNITGNELCEFKHLTEETITLVPEIRNAITEFSAKLN